MRAADPTVEVFADLDEGAGKLRGDRLVEIALGKVLTSVGQSVHGIGALSHVGGELHHFHHRMDREWDCSSP
jgi:hypothetical protein